MTEEKTDICIHDKDRWNEGCEMCNALNSLSNSNVTLQKYDEEDFTLTLEELAKKYGIQD